MLSLTVNSTIIMDRDYVVVVCNKLANDKITEIRITEIRIFIIITVLPIINLCRLNCRIFA